MDFYPVVAASSSGLNSPCRLIGKPHKNCGGAKTDPSISVHHSPVSPVRSNKPFAARLLLLISVSLIIKLSCLAGFPVGSLGGWKESCGRRRSLSLAAHDLLVSYKFSLGLSARATRPDSHRQRFQRGGKVDTASYPI